MNNTIPLPPHVGEEYHGPSQSPVKLYDADQLHAHAAAVSAAKDAEIAGLRDELLREHADHKETIEDAATVVHQNTALRERVRVLEDALTKIDAIRNDIIGRQKIGWSQHVYPLVAALDEAGYPGMEYEAARAALGDKTPNARLSG